MKKNLCEEQLIRRYNNDAEFTLQAHMVVALAFVPLHSLDAAFDVITDTQTGLDPALQPVLNWLEDNYIGRLHRNGTR